MRRVEFDPAALTDAKQKAWWKAWLLRAEGATVEAVNCWEEWLCDPQGKETFKCEFKDDIWAELKDWLLEHLFGWHCAYCETYLTRSPGDAEHFRPKGRVKLQRKPAVFALVDLDVPPGSPKTRLRHPGYFWLAYDWRNLVPACTECNAGERGKVDLFPAIGGHIILRRLNEEHKAGLRAPARESTRWPGYYYLNPLDLDDIEKPGIINPLNAGPDQDPGRHLCFGERGAVFAKGSSALGEACIDIFNLDTERLRTARHKAQAAALRAYLGAMAHLAMDLPEAARAAQYVLAPYKTGEEEYSTAVLDYIDLFMKRQGFVRDGPSVSS